MQRERRVTGRSGDASDEAPADSTSGWGLKKIPAVIPADEAFRAPQRKRLPAGEALSRAIFAGVRDEAGDIDSAGGAKSPVRGSEP